MNKSFFRSTVSAHKLAFFIVAGAVTASAAGAVLLTTGSGVTGVVQATASFVEPTDIKIKVGDDKQDVIHVPDARDTVMQQIVITPGGHTGWHSHPGPVVVLIKSGTMSFYDGDDPTCTVRTYTVGQAFIDSGQGHVHIARNEGSSNLELWATYFDVPTEGPAPRFRIDAPAPGNCAF
jgi:quercetin dioxygenase-like cupin family protein